MATTLKIDRIANVNATSKKLDIPGGAQGCYLYSAVAARMNPGDSVDSTNYAPFDAGYFPFFIECEGSKSIMVAAASGNLGELVAVWMKGVTVQQ